MSPMWFYRDKKMANLESVSAINVEIATLHFLTISEPRRS